MADQPQKSQQALGNVEQAAVSSGENPEILKLEEDLKAIIKEAGGSEEQVGKTEEPQKVHEQETWVERPVMKTEVVGEKAVSSPEVVAQKRAEMPAQQNQQEVEQTKEAVVEKTEQAVESATPVLPQTPHQETVKEEVPEKGTEVEKKEPVPTTEEIKEELPKEVSYETKTVDDELDKQLKELGVLTSEGKPAVANKPLTPPPAEAYRTTEVIPPKVEKRSPSVIIAMILAVIGFLLLILIVLGVLARSGVNIPIISQYVQPPVRQGVPTDLGPVVVKEEPKTDNNTATKSATPNATQQNATGSATSSDKNGFLTIIESTQSSKPKP